MLRYFHFLVEFYMHKSVRLNLCYVGLRPLLLLIDFLLLLLHRQVESNVWGNFANEFNDHIVSRLQIELVLQDNFDCFIHRRLNDFLLIDCHCSIIKS
jgi:hypothetical protein